MFDREFTVLEKWVRPLVSGTLSLYDIHASG